VGTKYPGYNFGGLFGQQNIVCYEINGFIMWFWTVRAGGGGGGAGGLLWLFLKIIPL
jgi:hypothetical protein